MDVTLTCPFGSECEEIKDNKLHRCQLYTNIRGKHPQSEEIVDNWYCSLAAAPLLQMENTQVNRGQQAAIESFRNEMVTGNAVLSNSIAQSMLTVERAEASHMLSHVTQGDN